MGVVISKWNEFVDMVVMIIMLALITSGCGDSLWSLITSGCGHYRTRSSNRSIPVLVTWKMTWLSCVLMLVPSTRRPPR